MLIGLLRFTVADVLITSAPFAAVTSVSLAPSGDDGATAPTPKPKPKPRPEPVAASTVHELWMLEPVPLDERLFRRGREPGWVR